MADIYAFHTVNVWKVGARRQAVSNGEGWCG